MGAGVGLRLGAMVEEKPRKKVMHRVLVVDDDHDLAVLLGEVLTYENCEVDIAANGMEALDCLRTRDYEAVVCDLMMPRIDGEALYHEVVRDYPHLTDRFLFVTGQPSRKAGFSDFVWRTGNTVIEKPFDIQQLRLAVREIFER
jgi:two-component system, cell cycle sensor histidine kinase and response regulator CckA